MSPRTSTWTEILGSFATPFMVSLGGECLTYRLGSMRRTSVKTVEARTASGKRNSSMVTQLLVVFEECGRDKVADHLVRYDAIAENETRKTGGRNVKLQGEKRSI